MGRQREARGGGGVAQPYTNGNDGISKPKKSQLYAVKPASGGMGRQETCKARISQNTGGGKRRRDNDRHVGTAGGMDRMVAGYVGIVGIVGSHALGATNDVAEIQSTWVTMNNVNNAGNKY